MLELTGKVAVISGAAGGLGAAHAELFVEHGAIVLLGDIADDQGEALARKLGDAATYHHLDVADPDDWRRIMTAARQAGGPHILVNNAGICPPNPIEAVTAEEFRRVTEVNQLGPFLGMQAAARTMGPGGVIINIGSVDGLRGVRNMSVYAATKSALRTLSKTAALEFAPLGIRVLCIHPGAVDTPMMHDGGNRLLELAGADPSQVDIGAALAAAIPFGRAAQPREIAIWSAFLAAHGDYATGAEFTVDGGLVAGEASM